MIEVKVPKDILKYKTRLVGPFTSRQILFLGIALAFDVLFYKLAYQPLGMPVEFLFYVILFLDIPIMAFGYCTPMDLPLEKYLKILVQTKFLAPSRRKNVRRFLKAEPGDGKKPKKSKTYKAFK